MVISIGGGTDEFDCAGRDVCIGGFWVSGMSPAWGCGYVGMLGLARRFAVGCGMWCVVLWCGGWVIRL